MTILSRPSPRRMSDAECDVYMVAKIVIACALLVLVAGGGAA